MTCRRLSDVAASLAILLAGALIIGLNVRGTGERVLLKVSYDPTREMYAHLNPGFEAA